MQDNARHAKSRGWETICLSVKPFAARRVGSSKSKFTNMQTKKALRYRQPDWPQSIHRFKTSWCHCFSFWTRHNNHNKLSTVREKESAKETTSGIHSLRGRPTLLKYRNVAAVYVFQVQTRLVSEDGSGNSAESFPKATAAFVREVWTLERVHFVARLQRLFWTRRTAVFPK